MNCLKCGKKTTNSQVFCDNCLQGMEHYPIRPGTPVHLPRPTQDVTVKKPRKRAPTPEEQISQLRRQASRLTLALTVISLLFALSAGLLAYKLLAPPQPVNTYGRNYTIDTGHNS